jgi:hypothetical protein
MNKERSREQKIYNMLEYKYQYRKLCYLYDILLTIISD